MPMVATKGDYTLMIVDDDQPINPREDYDPFGKMICFHGRYNLGDQHSYDEPGDLLKQILFSEYSTPAKGSNPVFDFIKSGQAKDAKLQYNRSTREWELMENNWWSSGEDWYVSSRCPIPLTSKAVPDWFLDDCLSALGVQELLRIVEQIDGMVILPLYLYDHSGLTMSTTDFSCPWDSGQVGWIYADREMIEKEYGAATPENMEKARQLLQGEVQSYDYYLTGQCYGFQLFKGEDEVDSCWGFLGDTRDVQDAVKEQLPPECDGNIVELLQFRYDSPDITDYLEELQEQREDACL